MKRPRIGITSGTPAGWNPDGYLWKPLSDSIEDAGGEAVWLGAETFPEPEPAAFSERSEALDGLLLAGGADLEPDRARYEGVPDHAEPERLHIETDPRRDAYEIPLLLRALEMDVPVFGICRGFQLFNVACGGKLIPDLRTGLRHRAYSHQVSAAHLLRSSPGGLVDRAVGTGYLPINSRHHQGVTDSIVAPGLRATAHAPDGVVEVLEDPTRPWRFAVQWHPERPQEAILHERDRFLFRTFVHECRRR
jgi:putative glutamine amidotransferase